MELVNTEVHDPMVATPKMSTVSTAARPTIQPRRLGCWAGTDWAGTA